MRFEKQLEYSVHIEIRFNNKYRTSIEHSIEGVIR